MATSSSRPAVRAWDGWGARDSRQGSRWVPRGPTQSSLGRGCTRSSEPPAHLLCPWHVTDRETSQSSRGWAQGPISSTCPPVSCESLLCIPAVSTTPSLPGAPMTHYIPKTPDFLLKKALLLCITIHPQKSGWGQEGGCHDPRHSPEPLPRPQPPQLTRHARPALSLPEHISGPPSMESPKFSPVSFLLNLAQVCVKTQESWK